LQVDVFDTVFRNYIEKKIRLPFAAKAKKVTKAGGLARVKQGPVKLYVGASTKSDVAGRVSKGASMPVEAKTSKWLKLRVRGHSRWVQKSKVSYDASAHGKLKGVGPMVMFQSPKIDIQPATMVTSAKSVRLKGRAADDSKVKDYYIFVINRVNPTKDNTRKLDYTKVDKKGTSISTKVPLFKGMNEISVIARDDQGMTTSQDAYVLRK